MEKTIKILVVDDDSLIREFLSDILLASGKYEVVSAENGQAALELYRQSADIGLILSDINMPVMDGLSLIRELRRERAEVPVVVLTGNSEISIAIEALNSGANDYLVKDENIQDTVVLAVDKALEKKRILDENRQLLIDLDNMVNELESVVEQMTVMGTALSSEKQSKKLVEAIITHAMRLTNADCGLLWIMEQGKLVCTGLRIMSRDIAKYSAEKIDIAPLALSRSHPVVLAAQSRQMFCIDDVSNTPNVDLSSIQSVDAAIGYKSQSMLMLPMLHHGHDLMGVVQLANAIHPATGAAQGFCLKREGISHSLALQAALAIRNQKLFHEMENLFEAIVEVLAAAIDERSPVTRGHINRVALITMGLAKEVNASKEGVFGDINFSDDELNEIRLAALLHDVGKITSPDHVISKGAKLETIVDRIVHVEERFRYFCAALTAEAMTEKIRLIENGSPAAEINELETGLHARLKSLAEDMEVIREANNPEEFMSDEKLVRLQQVYAKRVLLNGEAIPLLTDDEFLNLSIRRGSLTDTELEIMRNHAKITIHLLNQIPFTEKLKNVAIYAGGHHEKLNGKGYPLQLVADQLPLQARIIAIADFFEALTSGDRPYKKHMPLAEALEIMESSVKRGEIDPHLFELLKARKIHEQFAHRERDR
ncbi:MAG: response regulator [Gallionella sp.]|nr:response regulator [Gallionella sp.]